MATNLPEFKQSGVENHFAKVFRIVASQINYNFFFYQTEPEKQSSDQGHAQHNWFQTN